MGRHAPSLSSVRPATIRSQFTFDRKRDFSIAELDAEQKGRERVVVLGSGWGGYTFSRELSPKTHQIVIVSPRPYFVFTPLLAGTSVGTLEFRTALEPVRSFRGRGVGAEYFQGWADDVDFNKKVLTVEEAVEDPSQGRVLSDKGEESKSEKQVQQKKRETFDLPYDKLVVAVGCYTQTFNTKGVKEYAYFLKDVAHARRIRNRLLSCFEIAALPTTSVELRDQILNFVVVGGGPTGIEWSAELHDLIHEDMSRLYPELVKHVKITVYDVAPKVLGMFDEKLSKYAMKTFQRNGISIKTNHHVEELRPGTVANPDSTDAFTCYTLKLKEEGEVGVGMCVWSTGLMMNPFVESALKDRIKQDERSHAVLTNANLQIKGPDDTPIPDVYAIGDCAVLEGTAYPATAQVASQKAGWLAKRFNKGDFERQKGFQYKDLGVMAYIGNRNAILQTGGGKISGFLAWCIWRGVYLTKSMSWRNRILIPIYWSINFVFGRDISRF